MSHLAKAKWFHWQDEDGNPNPARRIQIPLDKEATDNTRNPNEEKEDDSIEAHLRQHGREIANLKGQIAENDYKTEKVQKQTAYLLHKNSKREEEAGILATIFNWPKEATLEDRKLNARLDGWLTVRNEKWKPDHNIFRQKRKTLKLLRTASLQQPRVAKPIHVLLVQAHTQTTQYTALLWSSPPKKHKRQTHREKCVILTKKDDEKCFDQERKGST